MHLELFHITLNNMQLVYVIGSLGVKFMFDLRINHTCRYYTICYFWGNNIPVEYISVRKMRRRKD